MSFLTKNRVSSPKKERSYYRPGAHQNGTSSNGHAQAHGASNGQTEHTQPGHEVKDKATIKNRTILSRNLPTLDRIHFLFLMYSAAHNLINAWHAAENALFFVFVLVGILSVELMLYTVYKHWKDGRLVGPMLNVGMWAGAIAMFFATAGILAQAQAGSTSEWITFYYQWILPTSAPIMFVFAFWIQSVDPIMTAERDQIAQDHLVSVEERRVEIDRRRLDLLERRDLRKLEYQVKRQKLLALWKETMSRRTKRILKRDVRVQVPIMLERVGISTARNRPAVPPGNFAQLSSGTNKRCQNPECSNQIKGKRRKYCSDYCQGRASRLRAKARRESKQA